MLEYEFWDLTFSRAEPRRAVCGLLTQAAEYHGWELERVRQRPSGRREVRLRRPIIRLHSTL
jgi:hypothetical protein